MINGAAEQIYWVSSHRNDNLRPFVPKPGPSMLFSINRKLSIQTRPSRRDKKSAKQKASSKQHAGNFINIRLLRSLPKYLWNLHLSHKLCAYMGITRQRNIFEDPTYPRGVAPLHPFSIIFLIRKGASKPVTRWLHLLSSSYSSARCEAITFCRLERYTTVFSYNPF